jgi:PAS domain S-box-containing protein
MDQGLMVVDEGGKIRICNKRAMDLLELPEALMSRRPPTTEVLAYQTQQGEFAGAPAKVMAHVGPQVTEDVYERTRPNGTMLEIRSIPFASGGLVRTYADITARSLAQQELKERERLLRLLTDNMTDMIARLGPDLRFVYVSPSSLDVLGRDPASLVGRHAAELVHPSDRRAWSETLVSSAKEDAAESMQVTYRALRQDGSQVWVEENRRQLPNDEGLVISIRNVSRRKEAEHLLEAANRQLEMLAGEDGLTCLANRRRFDEVLQVEFGRANRDGTPLSLIMIDVDRPAIVGTGHTLPVGVRVVARAATA